jgi:flagellar protein FlaF
MGFSVSGSAVLLFAGLLVAFGMWSTAAANGLERVQEAESDRTDRLLEQRNTDVDVATANWNGAALTVDIENTGSAQVRVSAIDFVVDGVYTSNWDSRSDSDILRPGETVVLSHDFSSQPGRVKIVTGSGVADAAGVT